ncbi:hypothetical protein FJZ36_15610 [Candidatus Poribacteria bacterium]|nr:hypothetical protein [Candidatus Poribacteria bacterium]
MRRLPLNTKRAMDELWRELDARVETARRQVGDAGRELVRREVEMQRRTVDLWLNGALLNAEYPMTMDVFVVGFPAEVRQAIISHLQGLSLRAEGTTDTQAAYTALQLHHTQAVLWDVQSGSPGSFFRLAVTRQPHLKGIAIGDPNDRVVFDRLLEAGVSAFIPMATVDTWSERIRPFNQCVLATLARTERQCPNFLAGRPCLGQCSTLEKPAVPEFHELTKRS